MNEQNQSDGFYLLKSVKSILNPHTDLVIPKGLTIPQIMSDYFGHLLQCVKADGQQTFGKDFDLDLLQWFYNFNQGYSIASLLDSGRQRNSQTSLF